MTDTDFCALVEQLRRHPAFRRAVERSRALRQVEEAVQTAERTGHPSHIRVAKAEIKAFEDNWMYERGPQDQNDDGTV